MEKQNNDSVISARVPLKLKRLITDFVTRDCHLNESDLLSDAIREKLRREAPELYAQFLKETEQ